MDEGFLRKMKTDEEQYEVRRIIKAFVNADKVNIPLKNENLIQQYRMVKIIFYNSANMGELKIISDSLVKVFEKKVKKSVKKCFQELDSREFTLDDFKNYMLAGAVASSQIEGSTLDLNSFYQSKQNKTNKKEVKEIENLLTTYQYAKRYRLSQTGLLKCHETLAATFTNITKGQKGKYRKTMVGIRGWSGLVYLAVEPEFVQKEMDKLFE
ncbi:MAG: hypothetical protein M3Z56_07695, partial [Bacteroidota bacterium]|nr:hypothetical protein [Bacteroidota bacterium]